MVWLAVVLAGAVSIGLTAVAVLADLDTAGQVASIVGAVVGLAGVVVSVVALTRPAGGTDGAVRRVRAGRGAVAAGGSISGNAFGDRSQVSGPRVSGRLGAPGQGREDVQAGPGGTAAGGNITDNAFGDDSRR
ncbi:hypothetical protein [Streptomyces sp. NPDC004266]|uniref:hypothetical protein n=1 Tax=Streptomyces sp. NPDC004266 TaxID=3364693 RepID=UPI0036A431D0